MRHRHINTTEWTPMALESLFDRGELDDWKEFFRAMKADRHIAKNALLIAHTHQDIGSAALVQLLVARAHPELRFKA